MKYNKNRGGYSHQYPVEDKAFDSWIKLDFNNDGKPDFLSPYHLRSLLVQEENQLDLEKQENRFILGRALYHIAQRRGFKSSKENKETVEEDLKEVEELHTLSEELKESERIKDICTYILMERKDEEALFKFRTSNGMEKVVRLKRTN